MIIIKYLTRETIKNQLIVLVILLLIFLCQKLIKVLNAIVDGEITANLVSTLLILSVPKIIQLILPISLSLGLLITFNKMYAESEITAMYACGISKLILVKAIIVLSLFNGFMTTINIMWIEPVSVRYQKSILKNAKTNPGMAAILSCGQFQKIANDSSVLYINKKEKGKYFSNIFLAQLYPKGNARSSVVVAESGQLTLRKNNVQVITLNKGTLFEGTALLHDFCITDFQNYQAIVSNPIAPSMLTDSNDMEQMDVQTLINTNTDSAKVELHWRITMIFTVFMIALIVLPLNVVNNLRYGFILPMLFYVAFFILQSSIKLNSSNCKINPIILIWTINFFFLLLAICLNLCLTTLLKQFSSISHTRMLSDADV